jgi:cytochrome bd ubiquinol oxidase subunit II
MALADVPAILVLAGLAAYAVLAGADFGAGFWQLPGGRDERGGELREHAHHSMGPVWEANHVWLIFVLVVCWTAYPTAFGSIASTLALPLFAAGIGIILRGTAYALRSGTQTARERRVVEVAMALASILTPFALGATIGAIASGRVPVGNAAGDLVSSWWNATSLMLGVLSVATAAYLAAVYLAADAARAGTRALELAYRTRALAMAAVAGAVALAGLVVVHGDAHRLFHGLTHGGGLLAVVVSAAAGVGTVACVLACRYALARLTAAAAVAAIVAGWGLAQWPQLLPGLSVADAAAGRSTLVALVVSLALGAVILIPSLAALFGLLLRGRFDAAAEQAAAAAPSGVRRTPRPQLVAAAVCLVAGLAFTTGLDASWGRIVGVPALLAAAALGFTAVVTTSGRDDG